MKRALLFTILGLMILVSPADAGMKLYISEDCGNCDLVMRIGDKAIQRLEADGQLEVVDVTGIKTDLPALPALIDGKTVLIGTGLIEYLVDKARIQHFSSYALFAIVGLGLADGINPCAFATMIFFVSFLTVSSYRKNQIAYIGSAFMFSVFLTYLALGLGIFQAFKKLELFAFLSDMVYFAIAGLTLGLGIYSLCDYIRYRRTGQGEACSLKLHNRLRSIVSNRKTMIILVAAAFVNGFIIALLESACTGQVYVPTIALISAIPNLKMNAFGALAVYNLCFILPLFVIFVMALACVGSDRINGAMQRYLGKIKLFTAFLFFGLTATLVLLKV